MRVLRQTIVRWPAFTLIPLLLAACSDRDKDPPQTPEACLQASSLQLGRENWQYSSRPATERLQPLADAPLRDTDRLGLVWYDVAGPIHCSDLFPDLTAHAHADPEGLGVILLPNAGATHPWAALTQSFSPMGIDLREAEYVELWVNDFNRFHGEQASAGIGKEIRIDLGRFNEDAVWDPRTPPSPANHRLDFEDANMDGQRTLLEDLGLDGVDSTFGDGTRRRIPRCSPGRVADFRGEPILPVAELLRAGGEQIADAFKVSSEKDPAGDDYEYTGTAADYSGDILAHARRFRHLNGTERNQRLDTEDLNDDYQMNSTDEYFEYTLPLDTDRYSVVDVRRDSGVTDPRNGWRLLRIPLADPGRRVVGIPDFATIRGARIWFEGFSDTTEFWIASFRVGSGAAVRPAAPRPQPQGSSWPPPISP